MYITEKIDLVKKKDGTYVINGQPYYPVDTVAESVLEWLYKSLVSQPAPFREGVLNGHKEAIMERSPDLAVQFGFMTTNESGEAIEITPEMLEAKAIKGIEHLMAFFTEFDFEPNFRFLNTFSLALNQSETAAKNYIKNYFELIDSPYINEINSKMKCSEFSALLEEIGAVAPTKTINNRFKLYYGSQGTGKTTIAMQETDNRVIVCNSSMLPADLMEDFIFVDGKATFKPSALWRCMEEGKPIVLDEINLLPFDSLRFLQGVLDGKKEFEYKGNTVHINEGFQIIGTMNLTVNGMTYGLPEPLVDRCAVMKKFSLSAKDLISAIK